ncbi:hypothetical protein [Nocardioides montaniterrae]
MARRRKVKKKVDLATGEVISPAPFIGLSLIACAFFLYAGSWLFTPPWVVLVGLGLCVVLLVVALRWWNPHPSRLPWVGVAALALWPVIAIGGGVLFG